MDGKLFQIVMEAESSKIRIKNMRKDLIEERKRAQKLNDIEKMDDVELDIMILNRAITNLDSQIEFVNLTNRREVIPKKFIKAANLTEVQHKVLIKRFIEKKSYKQIESELAHFNHNLNARDSFKKANSKIKKAASSYQEAIGLGFNEKEALQYIQMSKNTKTIWLMYRDGQTYSEISKILKVSKPYISKVLKPFKKY
ncbi:hypothetical protein VQL36_03680 [Chengkuizengella sp. SCS-71B]|uniref:hypothetical protein n=1 Tax=Chengkuizengella sp. SCS-71B TaxID=3115290 RepID=UPI0032C247D2